MTVTSAEDSAHVEHYAGRQFRFYNILMICMMAVGSLAVGYANSVIAIAVAQPSFAATFDLEHRSDTNTLIGLTNSMFQAGGFFGALLSCFCLDRWGRRWGIAVPAAGSVISAALMAGSVHIGMFIAFRFMSGAATFALVAAIPVWMSEVAPPRIRGALVTVHNFSLLIGFAIASCKHSSTLTL